MLFKVKSKNNETIQVNHFQPENPEEKDACVISTIDILIPADSGDFAAAAMVLGCKEKFLDKIMAPEDYDKDQKEMFARAEAVLAQLQNSLKPV